MLSLKFPHDKGDDVTDEAAEVHLLAPLPVFFFFQNCSDIIGLRNVFLGWFGPEISKRKWQEMISTL